MLQALRNTDVEPANTVEIIVHITETLGEERRRDLVSALESEDSIVSGVLSFTQPPHAGEIRPGCCILARRIVERHIAELQRQADWACVTVSSAVITSGLRAAFFLSEYPKLLQRRSRLQSL